MTVRASPDLDRFKCVPDCATILIGSSLIGGTCTCPANTIDNGAGACSDCDDILTGSTLVGGTCECPDGEIDNRAGACVPDVCPDGEIDNGAGACVPDCATILIGSSLDGGTCTCPGDLVDDGAGACRTCDSILPRSTKVGNTCQCTRVSGGFPEIENGGTCAYECPNVIPGSSNIPGEYYCECPPGQIYDGPNLLGSGPTGEKCVPDCANLLPGSTLEMEKPAFAQMV